MYRDCIGTKDYSKKIKPVEESKEAGLTGLCLLLMRDQCDCSRHSCIYAYLEMQSWKMNVTCVAINVNNVELQTSLLESFWENHP